MAANSSLPRAPEMAAPPSSPILAAADAGIVQTAVGSSPLPVSEAPSITYSKAIGATDSIVPYEASAQRVCTSIPSSHVKNGSRSRSRIFV